MESQARAPSSGYLPSLDGWRALAILGVLMDHDEPWTLMGHSNAAFHVYGGWGVYLFFALSGYLVTTRILQDEAKLGKFRIGRFYTRRFFRIQPAAFTYLFVIAALSVAGILHERRSALLGGLFLVQNYLFNSADHSGTWVLTGHFWTLALEEHFYLILSLVFFYFRRRRTLALILVLVSMYFLQRLGIHFRIYSPETASRRTELNLQYLIVPALFAVLLQHRQILGLATRFLLPWVAFTGTLLAEVIGLLHRPGASSRPGVVSFFTAEPRIFFYAVSFWVIATVLHPRSWTTRVLELRPFKYLGRLSYSIYLWHVLFFVAGDPVAHVHSPVMLFLAARPWRYIATALASLLSYYLVEKPMIRLGHHLAPPATPGHADLATAGAP